MTGEQSYVVVQAVAGKEEDARVLMHELGYEGAGPWMVRYGIDFPAAREDLVRRLDQARSDWYEVVSVGDLPDHPKA